MISEWTYRPLGELVSFASGGTPSKKRDDYWGGTIPWISAKTLKTENIDTSDLFITEEGLKAGSKIAPKGSILLLTRGSGLFNGIPIARVEKDVAFNQDIKCLDSYGEVENEFIFYWLLSQKDYLMAKVGVTGIGAGKFDLDFLQKLMVPIPSERERKSIVGFASSISEKIRCNAKINDNLEQQAQAIYHERFETVSPNDSPSDWRIVTLGEVATISNKSFNPLKEPEILLEHYSIPAFDEARFPVFELSTSIKSNKFIIDASCFMISKLNPTTKRVWKPYCLTENAVCSTEYIVYKAKDKSITNFLYSVIDSNSFSDFMCSHVTGSTGSRQRTTPSDTLSYELILPSEDELEEFQSLVSPMYAQIRINAIENDKLKRLRDSLLPKLMSGEIDVSDVQI